MADEPKPVKPPKPPKFLGIKASARATALLGAVFAIPAALLATAKFTEWDFAVHIGNTRADNGPTTEQMTAAVLASASPQMQALGPAAPPSAFDVLRQADALTRSPTAPIDRLRLAGVFNRAAGLIRDTRIHNIDELNRHLDSQWPRVLGSAYPNWQPFLEQWAERLNYSNQNNEFQSMNDVGEFLKGTESLLREGH